MSAIERLGLSDGATATAAAPSARQSQTREAFGYKWARRESYDTPAMQEFTRRWLLEKYCDGDAERLAAWLGDGRSLILDAGCGAGLSAAALFGDLLRRHDYLGVDISDSVEVARRRFEELGYPGDFLQADLFDLPIDDRTVDLIFSEGVLHHTDDTAAAIGALAAKLRPGGRFLFYVYAKKGPIREFTDDLVREHIAPMSDEEAWRAVEPITRLGIALGEVNADIEIPEDIPVLGIKAGRMDLQRFFYYSVMKAYYRPDFSFDAMNHINFDWFRPANCHRHTEEEVRAYCERAGLGIERLHAEPSGFAVVAIR